LTPSLAELAEKKKKKYFNFSRSHLSHLKNGEGRVESLLAMVCKDKEIFFISLSDYIIYFTQPREYDCLAAKTFHFLNIFFIKKKSLIYQKNLKRIAEKAEKKLKSFFKLTLISFSHSLCFSHDVMLFH
jgi:hypothetical protein